MLQYDTTINYAWVGKVDLAFHPYHEEHKTFTNDEEILEYIKHIEKSFEDMYS